MALQAPMPSNQKWFNGIGANPIGGYTCDNVLYHLFYGWCLVCWGRDAVNGASIQTPY